MNPSELFSEFVNEERFLTLEPGLQNTIIDIFNAMFFPNQTNIEKYLKISNLSGEKNPLGISMEEKKARQYLFKELYDKQKKIASHWNNNVDGMFVAYPAQQYLKNGYYDKEGETPILTNGGVISNGLGKNILIGFIPYPAVKFSRKNDKNGYLRGMLKDSLEEWKTNLGLRGDNIVSFAGILPSIFKEAEGELPPGVVDGIWGTIFSIMTVLDGYLKKNKLNKEIPLAVAGMGRVGVELVESLQKRGFKNLYGLEFYKKELNEISAKLSIPVFDNLNILPEDVVLINLLRDSKKIKSFAGPIICDAYPFKIDGKNIKVSASYDNMKAFPKIPGYQGIMGCAIEQMIASDIDRTINKENHLEIYKQIQDKISSTAILTNFEIYKNLINSLR